MGFSGWLDSREYLWDLLGSLKSSGIWYVDSEGRTVLYACAYVRMYWLTGRTGNSGLHKSSSRMKQLADLMQSDRSLSYLALAPFLQQRQLHDKGGGADI